METEENTKLLIDNLNVNYDKLVVLNQGIEANMK